MRSRKDAVEQRCVDNVHKVPHCAEDDNVTELAAQGAMTYSMMMLASSTQCSNVAIIVRTVVTFVLSFANGVTSLH